MCKQCIDDAREDFPDLPETASPMDIAKRILPDAHEDYLGYALWNETAYPFNHYRERGGYHPGWGDQLRALRATTPPTAADTRTSRKEEQHDGC